MYSDTSNLYQYPTWVAAPGQNDYIPKASAPPPESDEEQIVDPTEYRNLIFQYNEATVCWALLWTIAGFVVWPCFIISFMLIHPIQKNLSRYNYYPHHNNCKITTIYGIDIVGITFGIVCSIVLIVELVYIYAQ